MTPERFKEISRIVRSKPLFNGLPEDEMEDYRNLCEENQELADWELSQLIQESGFDMGEHCCLSMRYHLIEQLKERQAVSADPEYINYDSVIVFDKSQDVYGIPIHDGGSSYIRIRFCPWCGNSLSRG